MMAEEARPVDAEEVISEEHKLALASIKERFAGSWKETRSENVDGFFTEMGVNFFLRKLISMVRPEMEIIVEETCVRILIKLPGKTEVSILKLHKEVENTNQQGKFKTTAKYENEKLVSNATPSPGTTGKPAVVTREITSDGELITTFEVNSVVCKRYFSRLS